MVKNITGPSRRRRTEIDAVRGVVRCVDVTDRSTTPDEWEDFSNRNINETEKQCQNSAALRVIVDGVLQSTCNDMRRQKHQTDVAVARRIAETRDAKEKLEAHLAKVRQSRS